MVDVFISYPRAERERAEPIKAKLEALGLDVFFDLEGIDGGDAFPDVIDKALRASRAVLACWSPLYFTRKWCLVESRYAAGEEPSILVPAALVPLARKDVPADFLQTNYLDLTRWRGEDAHEDWNRVLRKLGLLLGRELAPELKRGLFGGATVGPAPQPTQEAREHAALLESWERTWERFAHKGDPAAVEAFLDGLRQAVRGSGLEFEVKHHHDRLRRAEAERAAKEAEERRRREAAEAEAVLSTPLSTREREAAAAEARRAVEARRRPGAVWRDAIPGLAADAAPEMVTLPPGRFLMGASRGEEGASPDEYPQHEVRIGYPLALGKYALTFAEWDAAIAAGAWLRKPGDAGWGRGRRPVINVSWEDAQAYIAWLNGRLGLEGREDAYRLPSEAEWEYACRGVASPDPRQGRWSFGDDEKKLGDYAWHLCNSGEKTHPVGEKRAIGLHDMHGNVWEWCEDVWHDSYNGAPNDSAPWTDGGDPSRRVLRGGSWGSYPELCRSASRNGDYPAGRGRGGGFRLARTVSAF